MKLLLAFILPAVYMTSLQAAETIHWDDLQKRFGGQSNCPHGCDGLVEHRGIDVITQDGRKHHARTLRMNSIGLTLNSDNKVEFLPRDTVKRIKIRLSGKYVQQIANSASIILFIAFLCTDPTESGYGCTSPIEALALVVALPVAAFTIASAPV